jgi:hypothetical protein
MHHADNTLFELGILFFGNILLILCVFDVIQFIGQIFDGVLQSGYP